jgi:hypothetical protein
MNTSGRNPWPVVAYEIDMLEQLEAPTRWRGAFRNAITESRVLHARQLCDIFLSRGSWPDDIVLAHLIPYWRDLNGLAKLVERLEKDFGSRKAPGSPCWIFNKMMAHATLERNDSYNYEAALVQVCPTLKLIVGEIESLIGERLERGLRYQGWALYLFSQTAITTESKL